VPDFASTTKARHRDLTIVLLEGKVASNKTIQMWDDKTKLGQEMRLALDSILLLEPQTDVEVVGILVRGNACFDVVDILENLPTPSCRSYYFHFILRATD
jgi:hypothetical protein